MLLKLLIIFLSTFTVVYMRYFIVGPAAIKISNVQNCKEMPNLPVQIKITPYMYNKTTQVLDATVTVPTDIKENITLDLKCSRIDDHKKQVNSFVINNAPLCESLDKYLGDFWLDLKTQLNIQLHGCIDKGVYTKKELLIDIRKMKVQMILEGHFKTRIIFRNGTKPIFCQDYDFALLPKAQ